MDEYSPVKLKFKIFTRNINKLFYTLIFGIMVYPLALILSANTLNLFSIHSMFIETLISNFLVLVTSVFLIKKITNDVRLYGFRIPPELYLKNVFLVSVSIAVVLSSIFSYLKIQSHPILGNLSLVQMIFLLWIFVPICEEVFFRGLIQGYLLPFCTIGFNLFKIRISLPILVSTVLFSLSHLLLIPFVNQVTMICILIFAFFVGLVSSYYREKTYSLIPAIIAHMLFNITSYIFSLFY